MQLWLFEWQLYRMLEWQLYCRAVATVQLSPQLIVVTTDSRRPQLMVAPTLIHIITLVIASGWCYARGFCFCENA